MEIILGFLLFFALAAFAVWRNRIDIAKKGPISKSVRSRTYIFTLVWATLLLAAFYIYKPVYIGVLVVFLLYSQTFGVGGGKHGLFRQLRDSGFIACVVTIPICLIIWNHGNA